MFTTISVYSLLALIIFWSYCGYLILLLVISTLYPQGKDDAPPPAPHMKLPKIAVFVPCYDEEKHIKAKIENLKRLSYEQNNLRIVFLNGNSTDNTGKIISDLISDSPNWQLIETGCGGKINQINYGLIHAVGDADIIVNTDVDAIMSEDVLLRFAREFQGDERIAVVGANISPQSAIPFEAFYWRDQNSLRIVESNVYTSSIVVAPCYAYRTSLISQFPKDCIADDVFIAFKANTEGYLTKYLAHAKGYEVRVPNSLAELFSHKFRKGNAFLIELFRYFYLLPVMTGWWKVIYLTKLLQLAVIPWALPYFLLSTVSLLLSGGGLFQLSILVLFLLGIAFATTSVMVQRWGRILSQNDGPSTQPSIMVFVISNLILILVGLSYPFYRQTSNYRRIGGRGTHG